MKNWKRLLALLLAGAMALSLCACQTGDSPNSPDDDEPSEKVSADPSASPEVSADLTQGVLEYSSGLSADDILLTVNGEELPADIVLYWLNYSCYYFMSGYGAYGLSMSDYLDILMDDAVTLSTSQALMRQKAKELGCLPTDAQLKEVQDQMADGQSTAGQLRTLFGLTEESIERLLLSNAYYSNVLDALVPALSTAELNQYLEDEGVFSVKHILLKTVDDSNQPLTDEEIAEKRALADDLLAQLNAAEDMPAKFDELMNGYSEDGGLAANPDGYTFNSSDSLVGGFREAALELKVGELSGIVETDYGYHIMLRLPISTQERELYQEDYRSGLLQEMMDQWVDESEVVRAEALTALDIEAFYAKMTAYQQAQSIDDNSTN